MQMSNTLPRVAATADEVDAYGKGKRFYNWDAGQRHAIKKGTARRERRSARREIRDPRTW